MDKKSNFPNFNEMYWTFERKYNPYPVQMSRAEAFEHALEDGLIDQETFSAAHKHFGSLWFYVGD